MNLLKVNQFRNARMDEDMMASTDPSELKAKALGQIPQVDESDVA
jgi:hypothetical protein